MTREVLDTPSVSMVKPMDEVEILQQVQQELEGYRDLGLLREPEWAQTSKWNALVKEQPERFIRADGTIDAERLRNFRRLAIFVADFPGFDPNRWFLRNLTGGRRGMIRLLNDTLEIVKAQGYADLLIKYPCSPVGHPYVYRRGPYRFNYRWCRHIYQLGLLNRVLGDQLRGGLTTAMDIGSSYGIFSSLLAREYLGTHHVLVDFPEQLLLARYFLSSTFPAATFAGIRELGALPTIPRAVVESHDFVLVPVSYYERLEGGSIDLVTNFASLGEMTRQWFDYYMRGTPFVTAKWFFTANRIQSRPTYDTDLTVVDYPIWDPEKRRHFAICPIFSHDYLRRYLFWMERHPIPPYFEYLGDS